MIKKNVLCALLLSTLGTASSAVAEQPTATERAERILQAAGIKGGLIVHIGCGGGKLTAALRADGPYLVHGLDTDAENVRKAREHIQSLDVYGTVSVARFDGKHLPYVDNLVNLIVAENLGDVPMAEVMRVLAPNGAAYLKGSGGWTKTVKPRPAQIDEWTHYLYDATNNAVSDDSVVGPPHQLQWVAGPAWARSHDHLASVSAAVSSGGRIFYIVDEGPTAAVVLQPQWYLVARDAFSGVFLWKRPIPKWQWHLRGFRSGPTDLSRRLVAVGDRLYVTLDIKGPLSALDGATGRTLRTYEQTKNTLEVIYDKGTLFVVAGEVTEAQTAVEAPSSQKPEYLEQPPLKRIIAIDAESGRVLWSKSDSDTQELMPTTLAVSQGRVFFQNPDEIVCLDKRFGTGVWRAQRPVSRSRPTWSAPTLVVYEDVVLSADRAVAEQKTLNSTEQRKVEWFVTSDGGKAPIGELIAFSALDGKRLWSCESQECYNAPVDVLVADGLVWTGNLVRWSDPGITKGRDPRTGEIERTRPPDQEFFQPGMFHHRCFRNKGTNRYLVLGRSGIEFMDLATGKGIPNHWVRGTCQYGVMPCNGLLYAPPHSCACFITAKLNGFNCMAPRPRPGAAKLEAAQGQAQARLQRGPAYGGVKYGGEKHSESGDWPTYRHDAARSGRASGPVVAELKNTWRTQLGGRLSSVVVAEGKLFVAQVETHTLYALEADSGRKVWSYTAGGRVDSPPTIWKGHVLFGCADGWVYCLRGSDGVLAWRFRAAPQDRRIVAYGQVESLWPVPGSVLVYNGVVYCGAGRSSYLDGSIRLYRLDAKTGRMLSETVIDDRDPNTGYQRKGVVDRMHMPGALPDILSCDGESVFMRHARFDLAGQPQAPEVPHMFSSVGFLDGSWWHRTYWLVGTMMGSGYGRWPDVGNEVPAGRLLALDDSFIYGFGRNQYSRLGAHAGIDSATIFHFNPKRDARHRFTYYQAFAIARESAPADEKADETGKSYFWTQQLPVLARALVLNKDSLFVGGPPDIFESNEPIDALEGNKGGLLCVLSALDGKKLAQYHLESPPVFDGMAAAGGRLYIATTDGSVLCFDGGK